MKKEELIDSIYWAYHGDSDIYEIMMNRNTVHMTNNPRDRDMFIAELKARILLIDKNDDWESEKDHV